MNTLQLLEEIRGIAQNGLHYSNNSYDIERYNRLLDLCSMSYSDVLEIDSSIISKTFIKEIGHITPKTGVNVAVFDNGKLLISKRLDDKCWELPGGWAELGETPSQTVERELMEEMSIKIKVEKLLDIYTRLPGYLNQVFTSYHILYKGCIIEGIFEPSNETSEIKYITKSKINEINWHKDHYKMALKAFEES